jgi:thiamine biosynthesis lipoprotein
MLADAGMKLDLGGAAKGMAAGMMREIAVKNNVSGFLSIGGNMLVVGTKPDQSDFSVGIRDPRGESTDYFATVTLDGYTMATTGDYERYFEQDGVRYHHVIDPFTGYPSTQDLISVTVISEDGLLADCLSTAIFLQGSECLSDYFSRSDCMVLAVTDTFEVYASPDFWERMTPLEGTKYTFRSDGI